MATTPKPKPPYRMCILCTNVIEDSLDAHMGPCENGKPHVLYNPYLIWNKETPRDATS